ncbi:hypothetical protein [Lactobacillus agrestimuris]|uniref:hypothetical protein n=1 Tax=Lactobacillus agrestimuris TaxID=2941328 RepID=UPI002042F483|nr:hypothetical protein [Lactobacillus agrestimuris]
MYLKEFINAILSIQDINKKLDSTFLERLTISQSLLEGISTENRSSGSPFFLNDLGVRYIVSAREYTEWNIKKLNLELPTSDELRSDMINADIKLLPYIMDACALITGDIDTIFDVVCKRKNEILNFGSYTAEIYSGTVCASKGSKLSYDFFLQAISRANSEKDINHVITGYHRLIITKLKRFTEFSDAQRLLNILLTEQIPKSKDKEMYMALYDNMLGLAIVMEQSDFSWISAKTMLINATDRIQNYLTFCTDDTMRSQAERYKGQVAINLVQLEIQKNNLKSTNTIAIKNLNHVKKYSKGYIAEAYSTLAYTQFLLKDYKNAVITSKQSVNEHIKIGNYDGVKASREMLIGNYMKLGMKKEAAKEAQLILDKSFKLES